LASKAISGRPYLSLAAASILTLFIASACHKNDDGILDITFPAAFVVNGETSNLSVINLSNDEKVGVIDLGGAKFPHHVYISPDQSLIAVAITSTDLSAGHAGHGGAISSYKVIIIDAKTGEIHHSISLEKLPHNAVFSPNGQELWVSDATNGKVVYYKLVNGVWAKQGDVTTGADAHAIAFLKDGTKAYVTNQGANTLSVISMDKHIKIKDIPVGTKPNGIIINLPK
jgi:YVTN family beta-propeller protein